jgi:hypothetical protein
VVFAISKISSSSAICWSLSSACVIANCPDEF